MTEELFATDAYRRSFDAAVVATDRDAGRVALGRTAFYPGGGGQPHDLGTVDWGDGPVAVTRVKREEGRIWHWLDAPELPGEGVEVAGELDWARRHLLMRTHTALSISAEPGRRLEAGINEESAAARPSSSSSWGVRWPLPTPRWSDRGESDPYRLSADNEA